MLPEDDRMIETSRSVFKCFNVNFMFFCWCVTEIGFIVVYVILREL